MVAELADRVRAMRLLGVREWGEIKLGSPASPAPAPPKQEGDEDRGDARQERLKRRVRMALASAGLNPSDAWFDRWARAMPGLEPEDDA